MADGVNGQSFDRWREMARVVTDDVKWPEMWPME